MPDTRGPAYTQALIDKQAAWWKRLLDVQAPYRWNLRRLQPGFTLDVGCGLGRNLLHLGGRGVGIDHNPASVAFARARGLQAFTPDEFRHTPMYGQPIFDSLILAHVLEHMPEESGVSLVRTYLPQLKPAGKVILITPQPAGYRSDPTHVLFVDFDGLRSACEQLGLDIIRQFSFPFPRAIGNLFLFNEFVMVGQLPIVGSPHGRPAR